ncbi:cysteine--tRNA ligase [Candidatus Saccharibacteria bacterium]|nr:cysteine--tRNA ligase [Candidatus Saccharibacteria bacterium]
MKLHNTLTRKKEDFKPINDGEVRLYSCGPTVYDYMHIGNLRKFTFDDSLRRALSASGYKVKHVMNITDVGHLVSDSDEGEDKLEAGAAREGKSVWEIAKFYADAFKKDMLAMNILPPNGYRSKDDNYARATDFIDPQIAIVKILLDKDFAYQTKEAIYFDVAKLPSYGELTRQRLSDKEVAVRHEVITDKNKRSPQDFGLWFFATGRFINHDMRWMSPWGEGFPGWHLECSAIIHSTLGDPIDIHTGGVDNIGTHHVNEMAQTEAAFGHKLARFWLHSEHLHADDQKMAKSKANFYTLNDLAKKGFQPLALRLLFLQAHYRSQMNFTWDSLKAAAQNLSNMYAWADQIYQPSVSEEITAQDTTHLLELLISAIQDDLNTPVALGVLNRYLIKGRPTAELLDKLDFIFGLGLKSRTDITKIQKQMIADREQARKLERWDEADIIRQKLSGEGLAIDDSPQGPIWHRDHLS